MEDEEGEWEEMVAVSGGGVGRVGSESVNQEEVERESGRHLETFEYKRAAARVAIAAVNKGASGMH